MNYRHAFHAGNFADVLKHVVLMMLVEHLKKKPAPFFYLDTHAGRGLYDLSEAQAQRSGEYKTGIGRLLEARKASLSAETSAYVESGAGVRRRGPQRDHGLPGITADRGANAPSGRPDGARRIAAEGSGVAGGGPRSQAARVGAGRRRLRGTQGAPAAAREPRPGADRSALRVRPGVRPRAGGSRDRARTLADRHLLRLVSADRSRRPAPVSAQPRALGHPPRARRDA